MNEIKPRHVTIETMSYIFKEIYEQSSPTQQQPESPEVVGTDLSGGPDRTAIWQLGQCFAGSGEMQRLSEELQKLAQTLSNEESCALRADELLQANTRKERHSSSLKEAFKRKNRGNHYAFKKSGHY